MCQLEQCGQVGGGTAVDTDLFSLIRRVAERNGAIECYPLETFEENGEIWLTCENGRWAEVASDWLFADCTDEEAGILLRAFLSGNNRCTYEIRRHLARLMATRGTLVREQMDAVVASTDWGSYASPSELLAYLAVKEDGTDWIVRLLDVVPNDARDGLFTACWYAEDRRVQEKLLSKFDEWTKDRSWGGGDGEDGWLQYFLAKWIAKEWFPYERLKSLVREHFKTEFRSL